MANNSEINLSAMVLRLEKLVPVSKGCPEDYSGIVEDAVGRFSYDIPIIRLSEISVTKGVATYDLPDDFLFLIELSGSCNVGGTLVTQDGALIPVGNDYSESWELVNGKITFVPTPAFSTKRKLRYAAKHLLTDGIYPSLTSNGERVVLVFAQFLALSEQANPAAGTGWKYSIGDEMVDKTALGKGLSAQAATYLASYEKEIAILKRRAGSTGSY